MYQKDFNANFRTHRRKTTSIFCITRFGSNQCIVHLSFIETLHRHGLFSPFQLPFMEFLVPIGLSNQEPRHKKAT